MFGELWAAKLRPPAGFEPATSALSWPVIKIGDPGNDPGISSVSWKRVSLLPRRPNLFPSLFVKILNLRLRYQTVMKLSMASATKQVAFVSFLLVLLERSTIRSYAKLFIFWRSVMKNKCRKILSLVVSAKLTFAALVIYELFLNPIPPISKIAVTSHSNLRRFEYLYYI